MDPLPYETCPVCGDPLLSRPDQYYECSRCGGVFNQEQIQKARRII